MIAGNQNPVLYVAPTTAAFGPTDEAKLVRHLRDLERATSTPHVAAVTHLQLDDGGRLIGDYGYTQTAFKQVCSLISPGLYRHVVDISGMTRLSHQNRRDYSFGLAVKTFNLALAQRFQSRIHGSIRLLKNNDARLVEGVMGPAYNYLGNHVIFDLAKDAVAAATTKTRFYEALLVGRRIMLRFVQRRSLFRIALPAGNDDFFGGYHFSNSEIGGEASVRAAVILLRTPASTVALGKFPGQGRLAHTGKDFHKKLNRMFQALLAQDQDATRLAGRMRALFAEPLAMDGTDADRASRLEFLSLLLHRQNIQRGLARRIVLSALATGADMPEAGLRPLTREVISGRTMWDLYNALTREAKAATLTVREAVEQAAYSLLMGRLRPK